MVVQGLLYCTWLRARPRTGQNPTLQHGQATERVFCLEWLELGEGKTAPPTWVLVA
eukprot:COSAG04_NODE_29439_length_269_cov_0.600000_1_plen_55_part_10